MSGLFCDSVVELDGSVDDWTIVPAQLLLRTSVVQATKNLKGATEE